MTELSFGNFYEDEPDDRTPSLSQLVSNIYTSPAKSKRETYHKPRGGDNNLIYISAAVIVILMFSALYLSSPPASKKTVAVPVMYTNTYANFVPTSRVYSLINVNLHNSSGIVNYSNATAIALSIGLPQGSVNSSKEIEYLSGNNIYQAPSMLINVFQFSSSNYSKYVYQNILSHLRVYPVSSQSYSGAKYLIYYVNSPASNRYAWSVFGNDRNSDFVINIFANSTSTPVINQSEVVSLTNAQIDVMSRKAG